MCWVDLMEHSCKILLLGQCAFDEICYIHKSVRCNVLISAMAFMALINLSQQMVVFSYVYIEAELKISVYQGSAPPLCFTLCESFFILSSFISMNGAVWFSVCFLSFNFKGRNQCKRHNEVGDTLFPVICFLKSPPRCDCPSESLSSTRLIQSSPLNSVFSLS